MKKIIIISSYAHNKSKQDMLKKCILQIKKLNIDILLVSHCNIPEDIVSLVDYYIFEKKNDKNKCNVTSWIIDDIKQVNFIRTESSEFSKINTITMAMNLVKSLNYEFFHFTEFDNIYSDVDILKIIDLQNSIINENKSFLFIQQIGVLFNNIKDKFYDSTYFAGMVNDFLNVINMGFPKTITEFENMFFTNGMYQSYENFFYNLFSPFKSKSIILENEIQFHFTTSQLNISSVDDFLCVIVPADDNYDYLYLSNSNLIGKRDVRISTDNVIVYQKTFNNIETDILKLEKRNQKIHIDILENNNIINNYDLDYNTNIDYGRSGNITFTNKKIFDVLYEENENKLTFIYLDNVSKRILTSIKDIDSHACIYSFINDVSNGFSCWAMPLPKHIIDFKNNINFGGFLIEHYEYDTKIGQEEIRIKNIPIQKINMDITNTEPIFSNYTEFFVDKIYDTLDIKDKNIVFDIGANVGLFTKFIQTKGAKKVYCFEPNPIATTHLESIFKDDPSVALNYFAVSDKDGEITLNIDDTNSLISSVYSETNTKLTIPCHSFESILNAHNLNHIDLVKMDIEGGEFDIIDNMSKNIFDKIDTFLIECHASYFTNGLEKVDNLINKLKQNGYEITIPENYNFVVYANKKVNTNKKLKIAQVHPGIIPIPTDKWGAVEKIIWNYKLELEKLGHQVDIKFPYDINKGDYDIVHVHIANQALYLKKQGIPYFFTMHDHHTVVFGKNSVCYIENSNAIESSLLTMMPGEFLIDYFNNPYKTIYLPHGVDTKLFKNTYTNNKNNKKLLCVANTNMLPDGDDRKGFKLAIESAKKLNLEITIAGPSISTKTFFENNKNLLEYEKLTVLYDLNDDEVRELYKTHSIFLNPSTIEAGHPNLTLLEALSSGLPVIATYEGNSIDGLIKIKRNINDICLAINNVLSNYDEIASQIDINKYDWSVICNRLDKIYNSFISCKDEYNSYDTKKLLISSYENTIKENKSIITSEPKLNINYINGAYAELNYYGDEKYTVDFIDNKNNETIFSVELSNGMYGKTAKEYFIDWKINLKDKDGKLIKSVLLNLENQRVYIAFESKSLGDNLAWIPYVDEFRKKHNCKVVVSTFWNNLFKSVYPEVEFVKPGTEVHNIIAMYKLGCFDPWGENYNMNVGDFRKVPLQKIAADILGLDFEEIVPKIGIKPLKPKLQGKYVCITQHSTAQAKYWNNEDAWQETVDYLNKLGYKVVVLGMGDCRLHNVIPKTGELKIEELIDYISNAEFFIGISSGLSWLAWALRKEVIMISGFTRSFNEFNCHRVYNASVCNGCYNRNYVFSKGNWNWCPVNENTDKQFECTKKISSQMVIEEINDILNI